MSVIKGQNFRMFLKANADAEGSPFTAGNCIALSTACNVHLAAQLEDSSTKDSSGDWQEQETVGKSWDCSVDALYAVESAEKAHQGKDLLKLIGQTVYVGFDTTEGDKNRTPATPARDGLMGGKAIVNDISINATNRQKVSYSCQLTGIGELTFNK